jgi:hypothetical protein
MSTPSMLLQCAGAAASLAGVWTLAGFSESSSMRGTPRVVVATAIGLGCEGVVYARVPAETRGMLALSLLFTTACVLSLAVGAAKLEAAWSEKDGPRVVRRAAGIVSGAVFGMAAVGAASLDLSASSLGLARSGWALMFALVIATSAVFAERARYVGVGLQALGPRRWVLALIGVALLVGARLTVASVPARAALPAKLEAAAIFATSAVVPETAASVVLAPLASDTPTAAPSAIAAPMASAVPTPSGHPGELQIETVSARGMLEADARGGVARRMERLQACLAEPKNQQSGSLSLKIGIDPAGSVRYSRATGGDLVGTPLAACLLAVFYKMGFAAHSQDTASFEISLRAPSP